MNRLKQVIAAAAMVLVMTALIGCSEPTTAYVESSTDYTTATVGPLFEQVADSAIAGTPSSQSKPLRHQALVELREVGAGGAVAADTITDVFPVDTRGVPVHVERALFDGSPALLVLEFTGPVGEPLSDIRLWVLDDSGKVLYSRTR